jgi:hypothetical protein
MERIIEWWMRVGLTVLFAASLLFGLAVARAEAGEAWVMWGRMDTQLTRIWEVYGIEATRTACEQLKTESLREVFRQQQSTGWITTAVSPDGMTTLAPNGVSVTMDLYCLPDTIDPRPR